MCGLCGFGLDDAQMMLQLDAPAAELEVRPETGNALVVYSSPKSPQSLNRPDATTRSLYSLLARALGIVWLKRVGQNRPAIGL